MLLGIPIKACDKYLNTRKLLTFTLAVLEGKKQHHHSKQSRINQGFISQEKGNSKVISKSLRLFVHFWFCLEVGFLLFTNTYHQQLKRGKEWKASQITKPEQKEIMHPCRTNVRNITPCTLAKDRRNLKYFHKDTSRDSKFFHLLFPLPLSSFSLPDEVKIPNMLRRLQCLNVFFYQVIKKV